MAISLAVASLTAPCDASVEGRTPSKRTEGTGNPNQPLQDRSKAELLNIARDRNIPFIATAHHATLLAEATLGPGHGQQGGVVGGRDGLDDGEAEARPEGGLAVEVRFPISKVRAGSVNAG